MRNRTKLLFVLLPCLLWACSDTAGAGGSGGAGGTGGVGGTGGSDGTIYVCDLIASDKPTFKGTCYEWLDGTMAQVACPSWGGTSSTGSCPSTDLLGSCLYNAGDQASQTQIYFYPQSESTAAEKQTQCEKEKGTWVAP